MVICTSFREKGIQEMVNRGGITVTIYNSIPCTGDTISVSGELQQFNLALNGDESATLYGSQSIIGANTDWTFTGTDVISGTLIITDSSGASAYLENIDYTIDYNSAIVTEKPFGSLVDLDIIKCSYNYHIDCVDEKTGGPNRLCRTCIDPDQGAFSTGALYPVATTMMALFHIPNYDSPFEKSGVWKLGDGVVTVPYDVTVNAKNHSDGGFFCQDKIKIHGQDGVWKVMSMPQTIQMGEFLGKRIHVRKIDF